MVNLLTSSPPIVGPLLADYNKNIYGTLIEFICSRQDRKYNKLLKKLLKKSTVNEVVEAALGLETAVKYGNLIFVKTILQLKKNLEIKPSIIYAIVYNHFDVLDYLIKNQDVITESLMDDITEVYYQEISEPNSEELKYLKTKLVIYLLSKKQINKQNVRLLRVPLDLQEYIKLYF